MFQRHSSSQNPSQQSTARGGSGSVAPRGYGMPSLFGGDSGPFALLRQLDEDMNRLFDEFTGGRPMGGEGAGWMPAVEMCERGGKLHVCADLPGMHKEDIKVDLADGQLRIQGERRSESSAEESRRQGYYRTERSYGSFYRSIPLPEGVNVDSAHASFHDGVLDIAFDAPQHQRHTRSLQIEEGAPGDTPATGSTDSRDDTVPPGAVA